MLPSLVIIREYITENGANPFSKWFNKLNSQAAAKVAVALSRIETGNLSNIKWFRGIVEYKINWGPGYRIYLAKDGHKLIILFGGGTKKSQIMDIDKAIQLYQKYKQRKKKKRLNMANFTNDYKKTIQSRINRDSDFAQHLLNEAISLILNDEPETARLVLRDLVNATIGFEKLSEKTQKNSKSLHRMLTAKGNPSMNNLTHIINALRETLKVDYEIHAVPA